MPTTGVMFWKIEVTLAPALCTPIFQNNMAMMPPKMTV